MNSDIEARVKKLEAAVFGSGTVHEKSRSPKQVALSQLSRSSLLSSGQKKIALIVGYNEVLLNEPPISLPEIKDQWIKAKFKGKCDAKQLERAITDGLVRDPDSNKSYDLTRDGEDFVKEVLAEYENNRG